jgi:hypothetical protein
VADIFNEVDEELRRERLKNIWDRYGWLIIAVALLIILGVGGWRGYQWWEARKAAEAGTVFEQAVALVGEGKHDEAQAAFARIASEGTAYRGLARMREAAELGRKDRDGAVKIYDGLAADTSIGPAMQDLARVRAGMLVIDSAGLDQMKTRLAPATASDRVFRHSARELMAFAAWRAADAAATKQWFDMIIADAETPVGIRTRTEMLMALTAPGAGS